MSRILLSQNARHFALPLMRSVMRHPEPSSRPLRAALIVAEVAVCFGPSLVMLYAGLRLLPTLVGMLRDRVGSTGAGSNVLDSIIGIAIVVMGVCGVIGATQVVSIALRSPVNVKRSSFTLALVAMGVVALVLFYSFIVSPHTIDNALLFFVLPMASAAHLLFLTRRAFFWGAHAGVSQDAA